MEKMTNVPPVAPHIFTLPPYEQNPPKLLGGFCSACKRYYFPRPRFCKVCLGQTEEVALAPEGIVYSFTMVRRKAPLGLPEPYSVGYVDLPRNGLGIFSLLDASAIDQLRIGMAVHLVVDCLGVNASGSPCLRPYFTPCIP